MKSDSASDIIFDLTFYYIENNGQHLCGWECQWLADYFRGIFKTCLSWGCPGNERRPVGIRVHVFPFVAWLVIWDVQRSVSHLSCVWFLLLVIQPSAVSGF